MWKNCFEFKINQSSWDPNAFNMYVYTHKHFTWTVKGYLLFVALMQNSSTKPIHSDMIWFCLALQIDDYLPGSNEVIIRCLDMLVLYLLLSLKRLKWKDNIKSLLNLLLLKGFKTFINFSSNRIPKMQIHHTQKWGDENF